MPNYTSNSYVGGSTVVDRRAALLSFPNNPLSTAGFNATKDVATMDAFLIAANGAYYTQTRLDSMLWNDKIFAMRNLAADSAGLP